jgi:PAS domain S-box-containing protein
MSNRIFEQQLNVFLQQLEKVWQQADELPAKKISIQEIEKLPLAQTVELRESLDGLKNSLGNLQIVVEELYQKNQNLLADKILAESECKHYQELFKSAPDAYLVTTKEGEIIEANSKAIELLNISPKRLIGKPLVVFIAPEERSDFYAQMYNLQKGESIQDWQVKIQRKRGVCFTTSIAVSPIPDQQCSTEKLRWRILELANSNLILKQNTSSKLEAVAPTSTVFESQLSKNSTPHLEIENEHFDMSVEKIGSLLDRLFCTFESLMICDRAGKIIYVNHAASKAWNLPQKDIIGKSWQQLKFFSEIIRKLEFQQKQLFSTKHIFNEQVDITTQKGVQTYRYTMTKISNLINYPEAIMFTFKETGKLKQTANNGYSSLTTEIGSNSSKTHFTSIFTQKLRDPLNNILACNKLLESDLKQQSNSPKNIYLQGLQTNVKLVNQLLDDLILMNKIETGQIQLKPSLIDLTEFCRRLTEELQQDINSEHEITVIKQGKPCGVWDEKLLRQTISNLLISAIQYSPKGREINLRVVCQGKQVTFNIHNYNSELSQQEQDLILNTLSSGTYLDLLEEKALRLLIAKECVKVQKGELSVECKNLETVFTVKLPLNQRVEKGK